MVYFAPMEGVVTVTSFGSFFYRPTPSPSLFLSDILTKYILDTPLSTLYYAVYYNATADSYASEIFNKTRCQ